jgi:PHD/YefM family antitoxin component YafN of YafNO toxin-antitoxin module
MKEAVVTASQSAKVEKRSPEIVLRDGQPAAVIVDIEDYRDMLERLEDLDDLEVLKQMREKPLNFRRLDEFLAEYHPSV